MGNKREDRGKGLLKVNGIHREWDEEEVVRERIRGKGGLLHPESGPSEDIPTAVFNKELITPLLVRMALQEKRPHPPIDPLREEVEALFNRNKITPVPDFSDCQKLAWRLRWLACFVKMKARRKEVSTEPFSH